MTLLRSSLSTQEVSRPVGMQYRCVAPCCWDIAELLLGRRLLVVTELTRTFAAVAG